MKELHLLLWQFLGKRAREDLSKPREVLVVVNRELGSTENYAWHAGLISHLAISRSRDLTWSETRGTDLLSARSFTAPVLHAYGV